jgi:hypothetical protein
MNAPLDTTLLHQIYFFADFTDPVKTQVSFLFRDAPGSSKSTGKIFESKEVLKRETAIFQLVLKLAQSLGLNIERVPIQDITELEFYLDPERSAFSVFIFTRTLGSYSRNIQTIKDPKLVKLLQQLLNKLIESYLK